MSKKKLTEGVLTTIFKTIFKGKMNDVDKALKTDPILKQRTKKLQQSVDELMQYMEENFPEEYK